MRLNSNVGKCAISPRPMNDCIFRVFFFFISRPVWKVHPTDFESVSPVQFETVCVCVCVITFSLLSIFDVRPSENNKKKKCTIICYVKRTNKTEMCVIVCAMKHMNWKSRFVCDSKKKKKIHVNCVYRGSPSQFLKLS